MSSDNTPPSKGVQCIPPLDIHRIQLWKGQGDHPEVADSNVICQLGTDIFKLRFDRMMYGQAYFVQNLCGEVKRLDPRLVRFKRVEEGLNITPEYWSPEVDIVVNPPTPELINTFTKFKKYLQDRKVDPQPETWRSLHSSYLGKDIIVFEKYLTDDIFLLSQIVGTTGTEAGEMEYGIQFIIHPTIKVH